jgi:ribosomal-protein-alanine N-acetyltransferase
MSGFAWGDVLPTLQAPQLTLRQLTSDDADDIFAVFSNPEVMRYWSHGPMTTRSEATAYIDHIHEGLRRRDLFQWGISLRADGRIVGTCTLLNVQADHERGEIGFAVARSHWGRGIAPEAVAALIAFAFERLGLHRLEADTDPRNERSLRLLERLGFRREGYLRERYYVGGERQDTVLLGLLRPEWAERPYSSSSDGGSTRRI